MNITAAAQPEPADKLVRLPDQTHRRCKAAAAIDGRDLRGWVTEVLEAELDRREKREPACVKTTD